MSTHSDRSSPIIARGRKRWIVTVLGGGLLLMAMVSLSTLFFVFKTLDEYLLSILGFVVSLSLYYVIYNLEIRIYPDRIERERFRTKTIRYSEIDHVHIPEFLWSRIIVWEKGGNVESAIGIYGELKDWRKVGAALLAALPETVEVTGDEALKNELLRRGEKMLLEQSSSEI